MMDYTLGQTFSVKFTTRSFSTGVPTSLSGGTVVAYPASSTTEVTAGITLTADFDGVTGLNDLSIVASGANGYVTNTTYHLVLTAGTVGGVSVVGEVVGAFGIDRSSARAMLGPANVTAATGDPGTATTVMAYAKQLVNILVGTAGVTTFPAEAAPANAVSLAEVIRAIHADVTGLNGDAMRGTDSAATASALATAQADLDAIAGSDGATLATSQPNYAPATAAALATAQADLDTITGSDGVTLATAQGNYAPATPAQVNAEVSDVLKVDTIAELPQAAPPATPTFQEAVMLGYMAMRNELTVDADAKTISNDAGTVIVKKALSDDTTVYTEAEMVSGP